MPDKEHWHLSKTVGVSQILSIVVLAGSIALLWTDTQKSILTNSISIQYVQERVDSQNDRAMIFRSEINSNLKDLNDKLDKLIVRGLSNGSQ